MEAWQIFLLIAVALIVIGTLYVRHRGKALAGHSAPLGEQLRKGAESIPVYGQFVKVAGVVGKPVNQVLDKFTGAQVSVLKHIPVVGSTVAKPLEWTQSGVKKLNNWLGL